jgi:hypothetical protein
MIEYKITGGNEVAALLKQLAPEIEAKILRNALVAGANVIQDEARLRVGAKSGELRRDIRVSREVGRGYVLARVKVKGPHAYIGWFQEYGVAAHIISIQNMPMETNRRGAIRAMSIGRVNKMVARGSLVIGGNLVGPMVHHPGHAPHPFFRPAVDAKSGAAVKTVADWLANYIKWGPITAPTVNADEEEAA